ncbi:MAG: gfo/Idh/MocA family oxidoreductase, partial [Gemmataceae bacterium]
GHRFEVNGMPIGPTPVDRPFHPAAFAQWRCERAFSGGPFTDLLPPHIARLLAATGWRTPTRVTAAGGLFVETDGRSVPDVGTLVADFAAGQLVITSATTTAYPMEEVIRGRTGSIKFVKGGVQVILDDPQGGSGLPPRLEREFPRGETTAAEPPKNETEVMWRNFLDCVRGRDRATLSGPELGMATVLLTDLGLQSYDDGLAYSWDVTRRTATMWAKR